jgi:hypothetical protein
MKDFSRREAFRQALARGQKVLLGRESSVIAPPTPPDPNAQLYRALLYLLLAIAGLSIWIKGRLSRRQRGGDDDGHDDSASASSTASPSPSASASASLGIESQLTIILTTSAGAANPSTVGISSVVNSLGVVPGLSHCRLVVVCDWPDLDDGRPSSFRSGRVDAADLGKYRAFIGDVQALSAAAEGSWCHSEVLVLSTRHGFGCAVGAAMRLVETEYVLIVQHDRAFVAPVPLRAVVDAMEAHPAVLKYVGFPVNNHSTYRDPAAIRARHPNFNFSGVTDDVSADVSDVDGPSSLLAPRLVGGLDVLPLLLWYDSTHVARVDHYREFVLPRVQRGDFIESRFGLEEVAAITGGSGKSGGGGGGGGGGGMAAHAAYGNFMLLDRENPRGYAVAHLEVLRGKDADRKGEYGSMELGRLRRLVLAIGEKGETKEGGGGGAASRVTGGIVRGRKGGGKGGNTSKEGVAAAGAEAVGKVKGAKGPFYQLQQRIGLVKRFDEVGALMPSLKPRLEALVALAEERGVEVPGWRELEVTK